MTTPSGGFGPMVNWNSALHPRAFHGRFGPTGTQKPAAPGRSMPPRPGTDSEDQGQMAQAAWDRKAAGVLRKQADQLDAQAMKLLHSPAFPASKHVVNAARSAAAKKAAATKAARGTASTAAKKAAATRASNKAKGITSSGMPVIKGTAPLVRQYNALITRADQLRTYSDKLETQASQLTSAARFSNAADTVAHSGARSDQLLLLDLAASPTSTAGRAANAKAGNALSDGSYPVPNAKYWHKALKAKGRTDSSKWPALKSLLLKRARELGIDPTGTWIKPGKKAMSMSRPDLELAASATGSMDGPRVVATAGAKLGLRPHQVRAYAKLRKAGKSHNDAFTFAKRVRSKANEMGTARFSGEHEDTTELSGLESGSNALGTKTLLRGSNGGRGNTPQQSKLLKASVGRRPQGRVGRTGSPAKQQAGSAGGNLLKAYNVPKTKGVEGTQAKKMGKTKVSAGAQGGPDWKGAGTVPRTHVGTGQGFKTPTNLKMKGNPSNDLAQMSMKGRNAYKKLRGHGISHGTAVKTVNQYFGAGKPSNQLGTRKGGPQTNLRLKNNGIGASRPSPKAV